MGTRRFELEARQPFRLDLTVWALRRRAHNEVDAWDGTWYRRVAVFGGEAVEVAARQVDRHGHSALLVEVTTAGHGPSAKAAQDGRDLLGRWHVLPGDDVGAQNNLRRRFGLAEDAGYEAVNQLAKKWWPYGGLVYFHLLLDGLAGAGHLPLPQEGTARNNLTTVDVISSKY